MKSSLADALRQCATLLDAGLTPADALGRLTALDASRAGLWRIAQRACARGERLASALDGAGLLGRQQALILDAAADAGRLAPVLLQLAGQREQRERDARFVRARLGFSVALFAIGCVAVVVLALARQPGVEGVLLGLSAIAPRVVMFTVLLWILIATLRLDLLVVLQGLWRTGLVLRLEPCRRWFEAVFLDLLSMQLHAGRDFAAAMQQLQALIQHPDYAARANTAAALAESGQGMTEALSQAGLMPRAQTRTVSLAAESAGSWAEAMRHYVSLQQADLRLQREAMVAWMPRIAYAAAVRLVLPLIL